MTTRLRFGAVVLAALLPTPGKADQTTRRAESQLGVNAAELGRVCESEIKAKINWSSFGGHYDREHPTMAAALYCGRVVDAVRSICEAGPEEKSALTKKVKTLQCHFSRAAGRVGVTLKGGRLGVSFRWDTPNLAYDVKETLLKQL